MLKNVGDGIRVDCEIAKFLEWDYFGARICREGQQS